MDLLRFLRKNASFLWVGILLTLSSSYGQTFFIAIFAGEIMADFGLSHGGWGLLYTLATTASAVLMFWAGALTDRFRVRELAWVVIPGLAAICLAMAWNTSVAGLAVIVFLLRLFGQGMMPQLATTAMARWFVARRGMALSLSSLGFSFAQAVFPAAFAALLTVTAWRSLWVLAAGLALLVFPLILRLLAAERTPASLAAESESAGMLGRHWTRREMLADPLFWLLLPMLLGPPAWGTALFFQQVHIAEVKGWPLVDYLALVPLLTVVSIGVTLFSGHLIDRFGSGRLMQLFLLPWIASFAILAAATGLAAAAVAFVLFGIATGVQATLLTAFWAEYYGTRHIGSIKAAATSVMVLGSAIGPGVSGVLIDMGFDFPTQMWGIVLYFVIAAALVLIGVARGARDLAPPEIDIKRA